MTLKVFNLFLYFGKLFCKLKSGEVTSKKGGAQ